jgi:hypothetical protein
MFYESNQVALLTDFNEVELQLETVKTAALHFLQRVAKCQRAVLTADVLEDKLDALADLITVAVAFNSLSIAIDTESTSIMDRARSLARC